MRTEVDGIQLEKYMQRIGLLQDMFPDHSANQREALTRRELLALRAVEEARLREKWAERKDRMSADIT